MRTGNTRDCHKEKAHLHSCKKKKGNICRCHVGRKMELNYLESLRINIRNISRSQSGCKLYIGRKILTKARETKSTLFPLKKILPCHKWRHHITCAFACITFRGVLATSGEKNIPGESPRFSAPISSPV